MNVTIPKRAIHEAGVAIMTMKLRLLAIMDSAQSDKPRPLEQDWCLPSTASLASNTRIHTSTAVEQHIRK